MNSIEKKEKGFTIIEVVLVLAIAGLIFLVVFLALPALQRQQRDTQRRSDLSRVTTAVQNYQSNNQNRIPTTQIQLNSFLTSYVGAGSAFNDPQGEAYSLTLTAVSSTTNPTGSQIFYYASAKCNGESAVAGNTYQAAVRLALENGGTFCTNN